MWLYIITPQFIWAMNMVARAVVSPNGALWLGRSQTCVLCGYEQGQDFMHESIQKSSKTLLIRSSYYVRPLDFRHFFPHRNILCLVWLNWRIITKKELFLIYFYYNSIRSAYTLSIYKIRENRHSKIIWFDRKWHILSSVQYILRIFNTDT